MYHSKTWSQAAALPLLNLSLSIPQPRPNPVPSTLNNLPRAHLLGRWVADDRNNINRLCVQPTVPLDPNLTIDALDQFMEQISDAEIVESANKYVEIPFPQETQAPSQENSS